MGAWRSLTKFALTKASQRPATDCCNKLKQSKESTRRQQHNYLDESDEESMALHRHVSISITWTALTPAKKQHDCQVCKQGCPTFACPFFLMVSPCTFSSKNVAGWCLSTGVSTADSLTCWSGKKGYLQNENWNESIKSHKIPWLHEEVDQQPQSGLLI